MSLASLPTERLAFLLKRAQHAFRTRVDDALRPLELTAPQYAVLTAVDMTAGISNAELARLAFVTPQTMQSILANLERAELLTRRPHPQHGRILSSDLTDKGLQVLGEARTRVQEIEQRLALAAGLDNVAVFSDLLSRCADELGAEQGRRPPPNSDSA